MTENDVYLQQAKGHVLVDREGTRNIAEITRQHGYFSQILNLKTRV